MAHRISSTFFRPFNPASLIYLLAVLDFGYTQQPCNDTSSIDITNGQLQEDGSIISDGITYNTSQYYADGNVTRGCICAVKGHCFRKCCKLGQVFVNKRTCVDASDMAPREFKEPVFEGRSQTDIVATDYFGVVFNIFNFTPQENLIRLLTNSNDQDRMFYLQKNGSLLSAAGTEYSLDEYCLETFSSDPFNRSLSWAPHVGAIARATLADNSIPEHFVWYATARLVSVPFLIATILVYLLVPGLRNLHGLVLISYLISLVFAYTLSAILQLQHNSSWSDQRCLTFFFIIYYSYMASFFWLNVMCFDIWWTFSGFGGLRDSKLYGKWRRFLWYSCYAWTAPLSLTGLVAIMQFCRSIPETYIKPKVLHLQCWFHDETSQAAYMHLPVLIVLIVNTFFFAATAYRIVQVKRDTNMLKSNDSSRHQRFEKDRYRLNLYTKLFIVMGINWSLEVISFFVGGAVKYWYVTDMCNSLVGVFIFFLFVCKKKIFRLIMNRLKIKRAGIEPTTLATNSRSASGSYSRSNRENNGNGKTNDNIDMKDIDKPATATVEEHVDT